MATSVRKENRWRQKLWAENNIRDQHAREAEAAMMPRQPRKPMKAVAPTVPTKAKIRNWMYAVADEYEGPTQLVEAANVHFELPEAWLGDETHWIWEFGVDAFDA